MHIDPKLKKPIIFGLVFLMVFSTIKPVFADEAAAAEAPASESSVDSSQPSSQVDTAPSDPAVETDTPADESADKVTDDKALDEGAEDKTDTALKEDKQDKDSTPAPQALTAGNQESQSGSVVSSSTIKQLVPETDLASGALTYAYKLTIPPGRNGLAPQVSLSYNSQNNEDGGIVGYGWGVDVPYIQRLNKKGTDKLYTENYFTSSLSGELVNTSGSTYKSKVEMGDFVSYTLSSNVWTAVDKNGTVFKFGTNAAERQDNPSDSSKVYKWMLQEVRDTNDNYIKYEYYKDAGQIYPSKIKYTGNGITDGIFEVEFLRQSRSDVYKSYSTAFLVTTSYRINEIQAKVNGTWVTKYALAYTTGSNGYRSLLSSITESGEDEAGTGSITLSPVSFEYQTATSSWTYDTSTYTPPIYFTNNDQQLVDVNGDAYPDVVESYYNPNYPPYTVQNTYLNTGNNTWSVNSNYQSPLLFQKWENRGGNTQMWDQGVRLVDVDGDQLPDMIESRGGATASQTAYKNTGSGWSLQSAWAPTILFTSKDDINDYGAHAVDLNGDALTDIIRNQGSSVNDGEQINNGSGFNTPGTAWTTPTDLTYPNYRFVDVNGDKLPDVLESVSVPGSPTTYNQHAYINKGDGTWQQDDTWAPPIQFADNTNQYDFGVRLIDVNGDQLVDCVIDPVNQQSPSKVTYLNTGYGWTAASAWNLPIPVTELMNGESKATDLNADGLIDFFNTTDSPSTLAGLGYIHDGVVPDLLKKVTASTGGYTQVTYQSSAAYKNGSTLLNPNMPLTLQTVKTLTRNDGAGLASTYTFTYEGGKYHFTDYLTRKFAGFAKVTRADSAGNKQITYYHQGDSSDSTHGEYNDEYWKIGKVYRSEVTDSSGNLYAKTINKWDSYDLGNSRKFVKLTQTLSQTYDGNSSHKDSAVSYVYDDATGNITEKDEWGEVTGSDDGTFTDTGTDKYVTSASYVSYSTANIYGLEYQETTVNQSSVKVRESKFYYDSQTLGNVIKGNQTKVEQWKTSSTYINTQKTYNSTYGTVTSSTDARGKTTSYSYDTYNLYPATVTDPLTHTMQYTYDYSLGKPKQVTDNNGFVYQTVYDGLDRVTAEKIPDFTTPYSAVNKTTYAYTPQTIGTQILKTDYLDGSTSVATYTYTDGFDRPIQSRKKAEASTDYTVTDTVYNTLEQIDKQSLPYFNSGSSKTTATSTSSLYTTYSYDPMLRVTSTANAVGTTSNAYDDWKLTVTDPRGKTKDLYKDAYGNLVQVEEHNGGSTYTTTYTYDGNNNLTNITDASSNVRNFTYDGLSRRLTAEDLHASGDTSFGSYTYTYDDNGNLTQKVDPNSQTINYTYDDLSRIATEDYTGNAGTEVTYSYDSCTNGVGKLCSITATGANDAYTYNSNGGVASQTKTISGTDYTTSYTYDRLGNQLEITNPDSSKVKYTYNAGGLLETVQRKESADGSYSNVISNYDYSPTEQPTVITYANGMVTTNTYDATKLYRLSAKATVGTTYTSPTTVTFAPSAGDGSVYKEEHGWSQSRTGTGSAANYTSSTLTVSSARIAGGDYHVERGFVPFDTSSLPDNAIISSGKLKVYVQSKTNNDNDGDDWVTVVRSTQSSTSSLSTSDFTTAGSVNSPTEGISNAERKDITGVTTGQYLEFNLNATGLSWVSPTSSTSFALREGHDVINSSFSGSSGQSNKLVIRSGEYTGTSDDPVLELTYVTPVTTNLQDLAYTYDNNGNITQIVDASATDSSKTVAYTYDDLNRLTQAAATSVASGQSTYTYAYTYDAIGNIVTRAETVGAGSTLTSTYTYEGNTGSRKENPHAVTKITPSAGSVVNYTYDNNGNMLTETSGLSNTWDYNNRLTQVVKSGVTSTFAYDSTGQRVKYNNGTSTSYYPTQSYNTDGTTPQKHISANGVLVANVKGSNGSAAVYSIATDQLTGANVVTNSTGSTVELLDYYPFGTTRLDQQTGYSEQKKYAGMESDNTGLSYASARYYNPTIGRFISQDPVFLAIGDLKAIKQLTGQDLILVLADPQMVNSYGYALNNPMRYNDPDGLYSWDQFKKDFANSDKYNPLSFFYGSSVYNLSLALKNRDYANAGLSAFNIIAISVLIESGALDLGMSLGGAYLWARGVNTNFQNLSALRNLTIRPTAQDKLNTLSQRFGMTNEEILDQASRSTMKYVDARPGNEGNINIWIPEPAGSGYIRVTTNPEGTVIISAGQNSAANVENGIKKGNFVELAN